MTDFDFKDFTRDELLNDPKKVLDAAASIDLDNEASAVRIRDGEKNYYVVGDELWAVIEALAEFVEEGKLEEMDARTEQLEREDRELQLAAQIIIANEREKASVRKPGVFRS